MSIWLEALLAVPCTLSLLNDHRKALFTSAFGIGVVRWLPLPVLPASHTTLPVLGMPTATRPPLAWRSIITESFRVLLLARATMNTCAAVWAVAPAKPVVAVRYRSLAVLNDTSGLKLILSALLFLSSGLLPLPS